MTRWLRARGVRSPEELAATAVGAAKQQHTAVPGEAVIAQLVRTLAEDVRVLNEKVAAIDRLIEDRFRAHDRAEVITSMPGIGPLLGAEFLAGVGSGIAFFATPDRLAAFAGLAPAPYDSGNERQPPPAPALPPRSPARLLHIRPDEHPLRPQFANLLRTQAERRQATRPSCPRPRPPPRQRPLGPDP
ncbi:IS110 family transposase [Streptomyces inhibens]|uniref:IS110 family transposase n=1 Tax=Streptomyces inhibens TaxID=2293571 RepID=A0A371PP70_STRIH|nr:IS110 family transposase [Streptomyces inhibens]